MTGEAVEYRPGGEAVEYRPGGSRASRWVAAVMQRTLKPVLVHAPLNRRTLKVLHVGDRIASVLRPIRGTTLRRIDFDGFGSELVTAPGAADADAVILHFHGGAFVAGGHRSHRRLASMISRAAGAPVLNVAYRQLPHATLDQTIEDCVAAYRWALDQGYPPERIVLSGDSAGGYLVLALALRALADDLPVPAAIVALSPWLDLRCEQSSRHPNADSDPYLPTRQLAKIAGWVETGATIGAHPLSADLHGLPPVLIQVGSRELLLSDAETLAARLADAGASCRLQVWDGQVHVFQAGADVIPEARAAIDEIGQFIRSAIASTTDRVA